MPAHPTLLLTLLACTWAVAQDERPTRENRTAQREPQLQQVVRRLSQLAEQYSDLKFIEPPVVEAKTHAEWRALIKEEILPDGKASDIMKLTMSLVGVYLPHPPRVVLSPLTVGPLLAPKPKEESRLAFERRVHHEGTIVHELVHALQDQHYKLPTRLHATEDEEETLLFQGLMEGHAVFVEERVATLAWKFEDFMDRGAYRSLGADPTYHFGHRYFRHVFREHGMQGVHDRLANPPDYDAFLELAARPLPAAPPKEKAKHKDKAAGPQPRDRSPGK